MSTEVIEEKGKSTDRFTVSFRPLYLGGMKISKIPFLRNRRDVCPVFVSSLVRSLKAHIYPKVRCSWYPVRDMSVGHPGCIVLRNFIAIEL